MKPKKINIDQTLFLIMALTTLAAFIAVFTGALLITIAWGIQ